MKLNDIIGENKRCRRQAMAASTTRWHGQNQHDRLAAGGHTRRRCCGLLMRAIMAPMNRIVQILEVMRTGDLSSRLNLDARTNSARWKPASTT
jgi:methyl-accepting chemotaxis protein WspA